MPDDENHDLGWTLGVLLRGHRDRMAALLSELPHGPRGYQTLLEVARDRHTSQLALAQRLGIDRTVMTYLVDDLVAAGLVERRENSEDRRQRRVVVTEDGSAALAALCAKVRSVEDETLAGLEDGERALLRALLDRAASASLGDAATDPCEVATEIGEVSAQEGPVPKMSARS
jgi:MarR family transcriptional regulator, transcriptional regulator for hemolysin